MNIDSKIQFLKKIGCDPVTTNNPKDLFKAKAIIFPGQGSFPAAMKKLNKNGIDKTLIELINNKMPFIGICLGLQLMFTKSDEGQCNGLNLFKGTVPEIPDSVKVPHIGWNNVNFNKRFTLQHDSVMSIIWNEIIESKIILRCEINLMS